MNLRALIFWLNEEREIEITYHIAEDSSKRSRNVYM